MFETSKSLDQKMNNSYAPILIFAYNRPDRLSQTLQSLKRCPEFLESPLNVFIDGPRTAKDTKMVKRVREVIQNLEHPNKTIHVRERNLGLKASISKGVSDELRENDCAIILEDDLILSPQTLHFFNQALAKFASDDRVWSISGYMYDVASFKERRDAFFVPFPHPWGWATWKTSWERFASGSRDHAVVGSKSFRTYFDVLGLRDFSSILELDDLGLISSWYVNWYLEIFLQGGVSLAPPVSLVRNAGMFAGTHASPLNPYRFLHKNQELASFSPKLPSEVVLDFKALDSIRSSRDVKLQKVISQLGRVKRRAKQVASIGRGT
ncbi:glycosyltransferase [Ruegeria atlantica]|uniref:glycosyltransferase n=1 Tax=Ruegeria atlantica TaxID=81569 RepID=UPI00147CB003|nr:glycosyltransferase [Ruegeria atlantica]